MRGFLIPLFILAGVLAALAGARDDIKRDVHRSANNYMAYPDDDLPAPGRPPEGYTPFFIDHYARHGSRWLIAPDEYDYPVDVLTRAEQAGCLTPLGKETLEAARQMRAASQGRLGELTERGAEQHRGIARRMAERYPTVFAGDDARVDARSTVVIRCILSMQNEVNELQAHFPHLRVTMDASEHDMRYMNFRDSVGYAAKDLGAPAVNALRDRLLKPDALLKRLFTDKTFIARLDGKQLMSRLFTLAANMQSTRRFAPGERGLFNIFTDDEIYDIWRFNNAWWYIHGADSPLTGGRVPFVQANLLRDFIQQADEAVMTGRRGAAMRFGHETMVLSLAALMGLDGADYRTTDLTTLDRHWQAYRIFPMACNIQLIFYRNRDGHVLVKPLLNEREVTMPITAVTGNYYDWNDVREFFMRRLGEHQP